MKDKKPCALCGVMTAGKPDCWIQKIGEEYVRFCSQEHAERYLAGERDA